MPNTHKKTPNLRSKTSKSTSKSSFKSNAKKVLKNRSGKTAPAQKEYSEAKDRKEKVVIWKSSRGRTEEKEWSYDE